MPKAKPSPLQSEPKERPGGRSERVGLDVRKATIDIMLADGVKSVSFERVAKESGVNRTTLYRRWGSRARLLAWALLEFQNETIAHPDEGDLEADLVKLVVDLGRELKGPLGAMFANLATVEAPQDEAVADAMKDFWAGRDLLAMKIVDRGIARGDVKADTDRQLLLELVFGPLYFSLTRTGQPLKPGRAQALVAHVLAGFQ